MRELVPIALEATRRKNWLDNMTKEDQLELKQFKRDFNAGKFPGLSKMAAYKHAFIIRFPGACGRTSFEEWLAQDD